MIRLFYGLVFCAIAFVSLPAQSLKTYDLPKELKNNIDLETSLKDSIKKLSFKEAYDITINNNYQIKAQELGIKRSQKLKLAAMELWMPYLAVSGFYSYLGAPVELTFKDIFPNFNMPALPSVPPNLTSQIPPFKLTTQNIAIGKLDFVYPLLMGGKRIYSSKIAKLEVDASRTKLTSEKLLTFNKLTRTYYLVVLNQEILEVLKEISQNSKMHLDNANKLKNAGQIANVELLSAQVLYDLNKNKVISAQNNLEVSKDELANILNTNADLQLTDKLILPKNFPLQNEQYYTTLAVANSPLIKQIAIKTKQGENMSRMVLGEFFPKISTFASAQITDNKSILEKTLPSWNVGVVAIMPILSPTGKIGRYQASKIAVLQSKSLEADAKQNVILMAKKAYKEAKYSHSEYMTSNSTIKLARENLRAQEEAYKHGMGTQTKIDDARNMLQTALLQQKTIAYKYILSLAALCALTGDIELFYKLQNSAKGQ